MHTAPHMVLWAQPRVITESGVSPVYHQMWPKKSEAAAMKVKHYYRAKWSKGNSQRIMWILFN